MKDNAGHMRLHGDHAKDMMAKHKVGDKVKMTVHGKVASTEVNNDMNSMIGPGNGKSKSGPSHSMSIDVHKVESDGENAAG